MTRAEKRKHENENVQTRSIISDVRDGAELQLFMQLLMCHIRKQNSENGVCTMC